MTFKIILQTQLSLTIASSIIGNKRTANVEKEKLRGNDLRGGVRLQDLVTSERLLCDVVKPERVLTNYSPRLCFRCVTARKGWNRRPSSTRWPAWRTTYLICWSEAQRRTKQIPAHAWSALQQSRWEWKKNPCSCCIHKLALVRQYLSLSVVIYMAPYCMFHTFRLFHFQRFQSTLQCSAEPGRQDEALTNHSNQQCRTTKSSQLAREPQTTR